MTLAAKTIILLTAVVSTVLAALSYVLLIYQEESLRETILKGVDGQAKTAAYGIESFLDSSLREARAISTTLPVEALFQEDDTEITSHLKQMREVFPKFDNGMFILDKEGRFIADYPPHPELKGESFAFREYYQRTVREGRGIAGKPYKSKRTGLPVLTFTAPIKDEQGALTAIVACSLDLLAPEALAMYRNQKFGDTGYLFIFDSNRQLVLHPAKDRLLSHVEAGRNKLMDDALRGFEGGGETINSLGVPMLLSVRKIQGTDWTVAVQIPQQEAYAPVAKTRKRILLASGVAILLVILIGSAAVRHVTKPLQKLEQAASQISSDLENRETGRSYEPADSTLDLLKSIHSSDEIGKLAASFLRLATELHLTVDSMHRFAENWQRTFNSVNEGVITLSPDSRIVQMNSAAEDLFRTSLKAVRNRFAFSVIFGEETPPDDWPEIASLTGQKRIKWSRRLEKPGGTFEFAMTPIIGDGLPAGAVLVINDITERVKSEEHMRGMAFNDQLTGLPNRFLLYDRMQQAITAVHRIGKRAGIMFLDLDHFKYINDHYGHDVGDEVLKEMSTRISGCLRKQDTLARLGGDEFVIVLRDVDEKSEAAKIAERIIEALALPLIIKGQELKISSSIGIAFHPDDGEDGDTLLKRADQAMYLAKNQGRNNYQYFS